MVQYSQG